MVQAKNRVDKAALMAAQSQSFIEGQRVWVPQASTSSSEWASGVIVGVSRDADEKVTLSVSLSDEKNSVISVAAMQCFLQNESDPDDLTKSDYLHEPGILNTLRSRYDLDSIYTYSGQILIALNPFKPLKHLFGPRMIAEYTRLESLEDLAPHCYAVAESAFQNMMIDGKKQAVLISGESGAGKTVTARLVMAYLAERSGQGALTALPVEQQILESNPLLEAFGNAKTVRNDNSSRFGKFVEIDFSESGRVTGAHISTYLLERSRVVSISESERSFHIFYQLLAGCPSGLRSRLYLPDEAGVSTFAYLAQSSTTKLTGTDDAEAFKETLNAMKIVGLDDDQIEAVLEVVAAVLHLGNIQFEAAAHAAGDEAVVCSDESSMHALENAANLLGTSSEELRRALMSRKISIGGDVIIKEFNVLESIESRDSMAKSLYMRLFDWIVSAVNTKIGRTAVGGGSSISVLDIYGFEAFQTNSFEQLCINLANEKLQQSFNEHVFKEEQKLYVEEGIDWSFVDYVDNIDVLDLLEGTSLSETTSKVLPPKIGVFPLLDEACRLPRATNEDLAVTIRDKLAKHPRFSAPKRDPTTFCINHYAGEVRYDTSAQMLERNRDFEILEHETIMAGSKAWLPRALYKGDETASTTESHRSAFKLSTIGSTFLKQLNTLSSRLAQMDPHYIRCIKPNEASCPGSLQPSYVMDQLRAGGVLEAVRIACAGFPTRKAFAPFARRYIMLAAKGDIAGFPCVDSGAVDWTSLSIEQEAAIVGAIMRQTGLEGWQLGRSRLFLRTGHLAFLEASRGRVLTESVVAIQTYWRAYSARSRYQKIMRERNAATLIQSVWRMRMAQDRYKAMRQRQREETSALLIQTIWRMVVARRSFVEQCSFLEELARQEAAAMEAAALAAEREASRQAELDAEEARRAAMASALVTENKALKAEVAALKSKIADLECKLAEAISASMLATRENQTSNETQTAAMQNLHDKMEQLNLRHADEINVLNESLASLRGESDAVLAAKDTEISHLVEQLQAAMARVDQLEHDLRASEEKEMSHAADITLERENTSKVLGRIAELETLLAAEKDSSAESATTIQALNNDNAIMSSRIDSLLQQLERAEGEISQLRSSVKQQATVLDRAGSTSAITQASMARNISRPASLDIERPVLSLDAHELSLDEDKAHLVDLAVRHLVKQPATMVQIRENVPLPLNSWRLRNFLRYIIGAPDWNMEDVLIAVDKIAGEIPLEATRSFSACLGSVNMAIASSTMLKVDGVGKAQAQLYIQVCSKLMDIEGLWKCLGDFIVDKVPINISSLLKEDARRSARARGSKALKHDSLTFEERLERCMGSSSRDWMKLISSIDTLIFLLLDAMPASMAKPVVWATLRYIDGTFLNALLMRRDLCSVSSARAILTALTIVEQYMTTYRISISTEEFREAFQRTMQASLFLVEWFDDAVRQARSGMAVNSALSKCSALSVLQLKRLAESRHDDLMPSFGPQTDTAILLQVLKSMVVSEQATLLSSSMSYSSDQEVMPTRTPEKQRPFTPDDPCIMPSPMSPDVQDVAEDAMNEILVDCRVEFALGGQPVLRRIRSLVREASKDLLSSLRLGDDLSFIEARCRAVRGNALPEELAFVDENAST